ncbi:head-tail adaptor protein [Lentibacter algarum]|jgi:head-tail adaptor|uniref:head-tail adaptor protein n=1 Tax=Lentibacter algarum TaxID=576131 RepID=UPI0035C7FBC1
MSVPMLNRQLLLEDPVRIPDGAGGFTITWQPLGTLWAEVSARTGRETQGEAVPLARVAYKIRLRAAPYDAAMRPKPEQRFVEGARIFRIEAVVEDDLTGRFLTCLAEEEVVA